MRTHTICGIAILITGAAFGQTSEEQEQVFPFTHLQTVQEFQETATVIRSTGDIRHMTIDAERRSMTVRGSASQIALAGWLVGELDQAPESRPAARPGQNPVFREYRVSGGEDDLVRVFYLPHAGTLPKLQEIAVRVRTKTRIPRLFIFNPAMAIVVRGTAAQMSEAERLINESAQRVA